MSTAASDAPWPERRFSQAIAEGDGISLIPAINGEVGVDVGELARAAEAAGAEAVLVESIPAVREARAASGIPVVARLDTAGSAQLQAARAEGADAVVVAASAFVDENAAAYAYAVALGLDCAIRVADEDELLVALETLEPEIVVAALAYIPDDGGSGGLALLTDVPAGKLVVVETELDSRDEVVALERAGVDALAVAAPSDPAELALILRDLIGTEHPLD